ncbi:MAG: hypothetical protein ACWA6Y_08135 [Polaromonas sp.]
MPLPKAPTLRPNKVKSRQTDMEADAQAQNQANSVLLFKGIFYALIGISVLLAPGFITSPKWHDIAAKASLAGWFAVVLGVAFGLLSLKRSLAALRRKG